MKLRSIITLLGAALLVVGCNNAPQRSYNEGVNIIPSPNQMTTPDASAQRFTLTNATTFAAQGAEATTIAEYFIAKIGVSTGFANAIVEGEADIQLSIDPALDAKAEGYTLSVTPDKVVLVGKDAAGLFYAMQSFMQLLPAEITSYNKVEEIEWSAPAVEIADAPRFAYRGIMLDVCRHFMTAEFVKKQIDILAMFKVNRLHLHLTEDQAWRVEIKKYPRLTEIGSRRTEPDGTVIDGFYTQEEIKEIVAYAAERYITIVPEFELPGHELAAITAYPELSCKGEPTTPRIIWGVEDVVMCPGKPKTFEFIEDVIDELVPLFPGEFFHVGGDECPKRSWAACPNCQRFIRQKGLQAKNGHTAEENLQSYVIGEAEKLLMARGKKLIGWDEILEGGLSPNATVMSWRGEEGGIAAATMGHDVVLSPSNKGLYINFYQGDSRVEPVTIGGDAYMSTLYAYDPTPAELVKIGKEHHVLGVQANLWTEYTYTPELMEYKLYPNALALAEIGWTNLDRKDFDAFTKRVENAYVRLDAYDINYHIPQPEQPIASTNFVAFVDTAVVAFKTTRPIKMVYTTDGSEPTANATAYTSPLVFTESGVIKIASILPSLKMSPVRTITVEKQSYAAATSVERPKQGLKMTTIEGMYLTRAAAEASTVTPTTTIIKDLNEMVRTESYSSSLRETKQAANIAEGYVNIAADGVYHFGSDSDVWIDGKPVVDNEGEVKRYSRSGISVALAKGLHPIKVMWMGNIIGGWPSNWNYGGVMIRREGSEKESPIQAQDLYY